MQDLGYDGTIERVEREGKEQFQFQFNGVDAQNRDVVETYLTKRWLSNIAADRIVGHATRVWEVVKIDTATGEPTSETKVLKDSWVEHGRKVEGSRYRQINQWFQTYPGHDHLKPHFLTFYADSQFERDGNVESTLLSLRGELPPAGNSDTLTESESDELGTRSQISSSSVLSDNVVAGAVYQRAVHRKQVLRKPVVNRIHYRILVNEVCQRIDELEDFRWLILCIVGAIRGKI